MKVSVRWSTPLTFGRVSCLGCGSMRPAREQGHPLEADVKRQKLPPFPEREN